jgi:hypothetical protein
VLHQQGPLPDSANVGSGALALSLALSANSSWDQSLAWRARRTLTAIALFKSMGGWHGWGSNLRAHLLEQLVVTQPQPSHIFREVKFGDQYVALVGASLP